MTKEAVILKPENYTGECNLSPLIEHIDGLDYRLCQAAGTIGGVIAFVGILGAVSIVEALI